MCGDRRPRICLDFGPVEVFELVAFCILAKGMRILPAFPFEVMARDARLTDTESLLWGRDEQVRIAGVAFFAPSKINCLFCYFSGSVDFFNLGLVALDDLNFSLVGFNTIGAVNCCYC